MSDHTSLVGMSSLENVSEIAGATAAPGAGLRRSSRAVEKPTSYALPSLDEVAVAQASSSKRKAAGVAGPVAKRRQTGSLVAGVEAPGLAQEKPAGFNIQSVSTTSTLSTSKDTSSVAVRATKNATGLVAKARTSSGDERPEPAGKPLVWAEGRQALCESLPYYRAFQSAAYTNGGLVWGMMLGRDASERAHMDAEVVIARSGGGCSRNADGVMEQSKDQDEHKQVAAFKKNRDEKVPLILIVGKDCQVCPVSVKHEYSVLDYFQVTDVWAEKNNSKTCYKYRLEKLHLAGKSWWAPKGSPAPSSGFGAPVRRDRCHYCGNSSKSIFNKWLCLNADCTSFWKWSNGKSPSKDLKYDHAFLAERSPWPQHILPPHKIKPDLLDLGSDAEPSAGYSRSAWKGMVCPSCGRCNARRHWDAWYCETEGCGFEYCVRQPILTPRAVLGGHEVEYSGHAMPRDEYSDLIKAHRSDFQGNWRISTYELIDGNTVTHFQANKPVNDIPGGSSDLFRELQTDNVMGLQRFEMKQKIGKGTVLASHFAVNYGMPYKYVVAVDSKPFGNAPKPILDALQRLTWAGKRTVGDGPFQDFNELLAVGYFEEGKMNYHDDGEKELGPTVATLSLGGDATMTLRMKARYHTGLTKGNRYNPDEPVLPGCALEKERKELNAKKNTISAKKFEEERLKAYKSIGKGKTAPVLLTMLLRHGDMVVMHGNEMQKYYEHSVVPSGRMRFALTSRFIKPELVEPSEHWKANFNRTLATPYYGDGVEASVEEPKVSKDSQVTDVDIPGSSELQNLFDGAVAEVSAQEEAEMHEENPSRPQISNFCHEIFPSR